MMQTMNQRGNMACSFQTKSNGSWFLLFFYCIFQSTCSVCPYYNWWGIIQFVWLHQQYTCTSVTALEGKKGERISQL
jgi:hypothetical protein